MDGSRAAESNRETKKSAMISRIFHANATAITISRIFNTDSMLMECSTLVGVPFAIRLLYRMLSQRATLLQKLQKMPFIPIGSDQSEIRLFPGHDLSRNPIHVVVGNGIKLPQALIQIQNAVRQKFLPHEV